MPKSGRVRRPREVFVSYAHEDHAFAARVMTGLRRRGIDSWFAPARLRAGNEWHDEIGKALNRCDWMLVILSPPSVKSEWVKRELLFALSSRRYRKRITPVVFRKCNPTNLSWTLGAFQSVSFLRREFDDAMEELLGAWAL